VLIIPEDFTKDQYMLKPMVEAMLRAAGKPNAIVRVCQDPRFHGVSQVMDWTLLAPVIERYKGMTDIFLVCVDRDGNATRREALNYIESQADLLAPGSILLAENAWQEIEVWVLAGHDLPKGWVWNSIRQEMHPKEVYYLPFAKQHKVANQPAEGRRTLATEAARRYDRIRQLCPEDIAALEIRIAEKLKTS
jgi:hypothetical protein